MKRRKATGAIRHSRSLVRILPFSFVSNGISGVLLFAAFVLLIFSSLSPGLFSGMRSKATDMAAPVLSTVSAPFQRTAAFVRDLSGLTTIQAENTRLLEENAKLREWYQTALMLEAENKSLKELLNVRVEPRNTYITARVLADGASPFAQSLLVAAGKQHGVKEGQAVISGQGLVGRVVEAGEEVSRILMISDMNSRVPVQVQDSRVHAIFAGNNGQKGRLMYLPVDSEVNDGARIVTSGQGGIYPVGLPVGLIRKKEAGVIEVEPFTDFDRLVHVRIVQMPEDPNLFPAALKASVPGFLPTE